MLLISKEEKKTHDHVNRCNKSNKIQHLSDINSQQIRNKRELP